MRRIPRFVIMAIGLVAVFAVAGSLLAAGHTSKKHAVAYFRNSTGLYPGDAVDVLGVKIGTVDKVTPVGDRVRVEMSYGGDRRVPADAKAAIIAPTLVSGRYIQLAPVYTRGPVLADRAEIPLERTAVPVSFDEEKQQVDDLIKALGPDGNNGNGPLADAVSAAANTVDGRGTTINNTLGALSAAAATVEKGSPDLFGALRNLQSFVSALAANDKQIVAFSGQLSAVSQLLTDNRTELDALLHSLATEMGQIKQFVQDNRGQLVTDVSSLQHITQLLVDKEDDLAQALHSAPTALDDFYNIYDPQTASLTGGLALPGIPDGRSLLCVLATTVDAPQEMCRTATQSLAGQLAAGIAGQTAPQSVPADLPSLFVPLTGGK
ncbi:MCE family protein [Nocardia nova]|uniref:Mammalian cell entry protein n=1 Tax=Nocardia nova TaxID=37330 RepID=A0A2S6A1V8_9NOCA|nr:MCE family protein [Nocardia nova]PPJ25558.1 mammalian cell entry protein [Nocardia nova]